MYSLDWRYSGLIAVFAEHFVRTGTVSAQLGQWLGQTRRAREVADYDDFLSVEEEEATMAVDRARRFLDEAKRSLSAEGFSSDP